MKRWLLRFFVLMGALLASLTFLAVLVLSIIPGRPLFSPLSTPEVFDPRSAARPEVVERVLGLAPDGYAWDYQHDWDGSIRRACLETAPQWGGPIEASLEQRYRSLSPPEGYWWLTLRQFSAEHGDVIVKVCVRRTLCPEGQVANSRKCRKLD